MGQSECKTQNNETMRQLFDACYSIVIINVAATKIVVICNSEYICEIVPLICQHAFLYIYLVEAAVYGKTRFSPSCYGAIREIDTSCYAPCTLSCNNTLSFLL